MTRMFPEDTPPVRVIRARGALPCDPPEIVRIDAFHPDGAYQRGVDMTGDGFDAPDEQALIPALAVLNRSIEGWPQHPVTVEQARALADG